MANHIDVRLTLLGPSLDVQSAKWWLVRHLEEGDEPPRRVSAIDEKVEWSRTWKWGAPESVAAALVAEFPRVLVYAYECDPLAPWEFYTAYVNIDGTPTRVVGLYDKETLARQFGYLPEEEPEASAT